MMYPPSGSGPGIYPPQPPPHAQPWPPPPPPPPVRPPRSPWRIIVGLVVAGIGLLPLLGGGALIAKAYSNSRQVIHNPEYARQLWRNVPAETLFPARLGREHPDKTYRDPNDERGWTRAAVSTGTSCEQALSGELARVAAKSGCVAALRATYLDDTGGTAATVALIAFRDDDYARQGLQDVVAEADEKPDHVVRALAAPGTQWKDAARAGNGGWTIGGTPMYVAVTAGPADGRRPGRLPLPWGRRAYPQKEDREPWAHTAQALAQSLSTRVQAESRKVGP
ncbi:hypothetical protein [Nonomuraea gerenzanensis]|uniref:hypothetical protein n=1 Tax=Nonomuraea gerenzanensis TaxID=93944 RepID=UPI001CD958F9|nr:hypothetical protein [Nonomuraea gerenzanensis]UBU13646.1 hypothetical protein LCN96_00980 [Nonomuraea gerenzanensis]